MLSPQYKNRMKHASRTGIEERISCKHSLPGLVFHEEADTVLCVARRVDTPDGNVAQLERFFMLRCLGNGFAVLAANDG